MKEKTLGSHWSRANLWGTFSDSRRASLLIFLTKKEWDRVDIKNITYFSNEKMPSEMLNGSLFELKVICLIPRYDNSLLYRTQVSFMTSLFDNVLADPNLKSHSCESKG